MGFPPSEVRAMSMVDFSEAAAAWNEVNAPVKPSREISDEDRAQLRSLMERYPDD